MNLQNRHHADPSRQTLLRIELPEDVRLYPQRFRELISKESAGALPPAIFHAEEGGTPATGMPSVRIIGGRRWVGVLTDDAHAPLVYEVMGAAVRAAISVAQRPLATRIEEHHLRIRPCQHPVRYWIREMALKRRTPAARAADLSALVRARLLSGIARMAARYGIDCPTDDQLEVDVDLRRHLGLRLSTTTGPTNEFVTLVDASFTLHAELKGLWFAGNLTARGYGRIGRDLNDLAVNLRAENAAPREYVG